MKYKMGEFKMNFDSRSKVPIYLQIAFTLRENILKGNLKPDEQMPSIRVLAKKMQVNPNTIKKAYRVLEEQNYLKSLSTRGTFVTNELDEIKEKRKKASFKAIHLETRELKNMGVSLRTILEGIEKKWKVL